MSRRRKHVTQGCLQDEVQPPADGEVIAKVVDLRGSNVVEVQCADGKNTLVMMPARFNKTLWVRRGGFLIVALGDTAAESTARVTGTVVNVLYDKDVRALQQLSGVWPSQFLEHETPNPAQEPTPLNNRSTAGRGGEAVDQLSSSDDDLPPLEANTNRTVIAYYESEDTDSD